MTDFCKIALSDHRVSSLTLDGYARATMASINPTIIEEQQLNQVRLSLRLYPVIRSAVQYCRISILKNVMAL